MKNAVIVLLALAFLPLSAQVKLERISEDFTAIAEKVVPKVVSITVKRKGKNYDSEEFKNNNPFGNPPQENDRNELGSGVIIDKRGFIVTNNHVIEDAQSIFIVMSDGEKLPCSLVGADPASDIAVIKIAGELPANLQVIEMADSSKIKSGQIVFAVGNAFGFSDTVTMGIISAVHREGLGLSEYENLIQTDAAINPGNSGGALVDAKGRLVGINNAIFSKSGGYMGVGFAIPSNTVKSVTDQLIKGGKVVRGWLGVKIQEIDEDLAEKLGIAEGGSIVAEVIKNSPAEKAGFVEGDIIVEINKVKVKTLHEVRRYIASIRPGMKSSIVVKRGDKKVALDVFVGTIPEPKEVKREAYRKGVGIEVRDLDEETSFEYGIREKNGVVITDVLPGSPAERAGLFNGDLIKKIEENSIKTSDDYHAAIKRNTGNNLLLFLVKRGSQQQFVLVKIAE